MELTKVDFKREMKDLYNPKVKEFSLVNVPTMNFLMITGRGDPNTAQDYKDAVEALYAVAYALKFAVKKQQGVDYTVMPLEGLWWTDADTADYLAESRDNWNWQMMIMQPQYVSAQMARAMIAAVKAKKNPPAIDKMRFEAFDEGLSVQIMYVGPYSGEHPTIEAMYNFCVERGYDSNGKHHEVYIGDPRKSAPEKLKTVLRHPIRAK